MKKLIFLGLVAAVFFSSCTEKVIYEKTIPMNGANWNRFHSLKFSPEIKNEKKLYDIILKVKYLDGFAYQMLPVNTVLTYPSGQENILRHTFLIQNENGYIGNVFGDVWEVEATLYSQKSFPETGTYVLEVGQTTQHFDLHKIISVSCEVKYSEKQKKK